MAEENGSDEPNEPLTAPVPLHEFPSANVKAPETEPELAVVVNGNHRRSEESTSSVPELQELRLADHADVASLSQTNGPSLLDRERMLQEQLARVTAEKASFEAQYSSLLGKLTTMRSTLGDKLRQDADELDRRSQQITTLQTANEDLSYTVETLRSELIQSNEDLEHAHREIETSRHRAHDSQKQISDEAMARETALRELQEDQEQTRMELEEWKGEAGRERVAREAHASAHAVLERELLALKGERDTLRMDRDTQAESASNLHLVLEEFQAAKDQELRDTLGDLQAQLLSTTKSLNEYKQRAAAAESKVAGFHSDSTRLVALQQEVKEKSLLIGKLRHEGTTGVILNEHLTEALRRLKKDTSENNVDRRLITNVLISFFNTPRADSKRFEMLSLLASILSWNDEDRERAGLQKSTSTLNVPSTSGASNGGRRPRGHSRSKGKGPDEMADTETFSNLWIEFLLREANANQSQAPSASGAQAPSLISGGPLSPTSTASFNLNSRFPLPEIPASPTSPLSAMSTRRPSFSSAISSTGPSSIAPSTASRAPSNVGDSIEKG